MEVPPRPHRSSLIIMVHRHICGGDVVFPPDALWYTLDTCRNCAFMYNLNLDA